MKTKTGLSLGLALTLMVGVFATMLALGLFTTNEARADAPTAPMIEVGSATAVALASLNHPENTQAVGTLSVTHDFAASGHVGTGPLRWSLGGDDASLFEIDADMVLSFKTNPDFENPHDIEDSGTDSDNVYDITVVVTHHNADDPPVAATGNDLSTAVAITVTDVENQIGNLSVAHSPIDTSAAAKVTVQFTTETMLIAGLDTITIEFEDDVKVPETLGETSISIIGGSLVANPLDVTVSRIGTPADESVVTLTVADMDADVDSSQDLPAGTVTVIFRQSAGIKNPSEGGTNWNVKVETSKDSVGNRVTSPDGDDTFGTVAVVALSGKSGKRGSTVTANGSGFKDGTTATVWLESGTPDGTQGPGEPTLCTADVAKPADTFTCTFTVSASFTREGKNYISARDGRNNKSDEPAEYAVDAQIKPVPMSAAIGDKVTVQLRDFETNDAGAAEFTLGGVAVTKVDSFSMTDGSGDATITIPDGASLGTQSLRVVLGDDKPRANMTVLGAQVSVVPSTAVPNQSVTITGRGFSGGEEISDPDGDAANLSQILIGGSLLEDWDNINAGDTIGIDNGGSWVATIIIPVGAPATTAGTYELKVIDSMGRPGVTSITVPARTVTFDPPESRGGTTVTVSGAGWVASNSASGASSDIEVEYVSATGTSSARANPDSNGAFSTTIQVPRNAPIPSTNQVTVSYEVDGSSPVSEQVSHRVPGAEVSISPSSGPGGTIATVTGVGFRAFTSLDIIRVGETRVIPSPAGASVGRDGVLQTVTVLIPALDPGTLSVKVDVAGSIASTPFTITADDALPPPTEATTPAAAFAALIDSGSLITVFRYNEDTQAYQSYDPDPANAGFNDLDTVNSGDIFWVRLSEDQTFLGKLRRAPWAQVVLP